MTARQLIPPAHGELIPKKTQVPETENKPIIILPEEGMDASLLCDAQKDDHRQQQSQLFTKMGN